MNLESVFALIIGNLAIILPLWLWTRSENRTDMRQLQEIQSQDRRDLVQAMRSFENSVNEMKLENKDFRVEMYNLVNGMKIENKDFHFRLLEIERSRIKAQL